MGATAIAGLVIGLLSKRVILDLRNVSSLAEVVVSQLALANAFKTFPGLANFPISAAVSNGDAL
jgi:hypothetical protein